MTTSARLLPPAILKEFRALSGVWLACLAAILVNTLVDDVDIFAATAVIFAIGSIGLGAASIGHEYTHRTLPLLLALPAERRRLLLIKVAVLAFMLIYGASTIVITFVLLALGLDPVTAFTAAVGCINNIGPGLALVGPTGNYGALTDAQTWVCAFAMLIGRLELMSVLVLLTPDFWRK